MPSPRQQSPERARLRTHIEDQVEALDITWTELARTSGVPYETIRRVRMENQPITKAVRDRLEDGLGWPRGSIRQILDGGDPPTPLDPTPPTRREVLDTESGRAVAEILEDIEGGDLPPDQQAEMDARLAAKIRGEYALFYAAERARMERERRRRGDA